MPFFNWYNWNSCHDCHWLYVAHYSTHTGNFNAITNLYMPTNTAISANLNIFTYFTTSGNRRWASNNATITNFNIMSNLAKIINFYFILNYSIFKRSAIYAGVGSYFNIVTNFNDTDLNYFIIFTRIMNESKTILTDFGAIKNLIT